MVIAMNFALQRWDDRMSHRYIGHIFALEDCRLFLHIEITADWLKHGKTQASSANWLIVRAVINNFLHRFLVVVCLL